MNILQALSIILVLAALFGYMNIRFLKLPSTIGLLLISIVMTLAVILLGQGNEKIIEGARELIQMLDFENLLMDFMLSFLLFAGALHTNLNLMAKNKWPILTFATVGVVFTALVIGVLFWLVLGWLGQDVDLIYCFVFGALISPTDPVAVLGILKKANVPQKLEVKIVGESLFNDGIGVVVFITFLGLAQTGVANFEYKDIGLLLLQEVGGGLAFGLVLGVVTYFMLRSIDHYETEVLITLAMVLGGFTLASFLHISGPLAMVAAGLFMGNEKAKTARSDLTEEYLQKFWELVDSLLNAVLFVLVGLELLVVDFNRITLIAGAIAIPLILVVRFISLGLPVRIFRKRLEFLPKTGLIMTWGGIRGGISVALALSIPEGMHREIFLPVTYLVVVFSILVQGLTLGPMVKKILNFKGPDLPESEL